MSQEIRFALTSGLEPLRGLTLNANFDEVEAQLRELLAPYETMAVTEEDMANAKNILARIRKVKTSIDEYRKSVKREYSAPLTAFESRVKELLAVCAESEENLSMQINKHDRKRREEKLSALEQFFTANVGDMAPYLTWEQVKNDKWGNATFSEESAQGEIKQAIAQCEDGVNAIRGLSSPFVAALLNSYAKDHSLAVAMRLNTELYEQKRREDERKAAIEAAKATQERRAPEPVRTEPTPEKVIASEPTVDADKILTVTLQISGTNDQLLALRKYLDAEGLRFRSLR